MLLSRLEQRKEQTLENKLFLTAKQKNFLLFFFFLFITRAKPREISYNINVNITMRDFFFFMVIILYISDFFFYCVKKVLLMQLHDESVMSSSINWIYFILFYSNFSFLFFKLQFFLLFHCRGLFFLIIISHCYSCALHFGNSKSLSPQRRRRKKEK